MTANCPLCTAPAIFFAEHRCTNYYLCKVCAAVFMDPGQTLNKTAEKDRYLEHNNDVNDPRYQNFVQPIVKGVQDYFKPQHSGLDFGAGTGPVISKLLRDSGYQVAIYDPFFHDHSALLKKTYNYIVCCEVIEHFKEPAKEFKLLRSMLEPKGKLFCMTTIYHSQIDFNNWYYKDDPTHCFFYSKDSLKWIKEHYDFSELQITGNLIELTV
jgi:hypothetical protein